HGEGGDERADSGGAHEQAEGVRASVEGLAGEDGQQHGVGHAKEADHGEQQDGADGDRSGDVGEAFGELAPKIFLFAAAGRGGGDVHEQKADDDGSVADAVDGEAPGSAEAGDDQASDGGAKQAGAVEHRGVEGNGVGDDGAVLDHFDEEGLAGGRVEGVDDALQDAEQGDVPDGDVSAEGEDGQGEGLQHRKNLGPDQGAVTAPAIDPDSRKGSEEKSGNLSEKGDESEHPGRAG